MLLLLLLSDGLSLYSGACYHATVSSCRNINGERDDNWTSQVPQLQSSREMVITVQIGIDILKCMHMHSYINFSSLFLLVTCVLHGCGLVLSI